MGTVKMREKEFERYPKYKQAYINAFQRMIDERDRGGYPNYRKTGEELERSYTNGTFKAVDGGGTPNTDDSNREVQLLDEPKTLKNGCGYEYDNGEELQKTWTENKGGMFPQKKDNGDSTEERKDLVPAEIVVEDKKITATPRWGNGSTGEEVIEWWMR